MRGHKAAIIASLGIVITTAAICHEGRYGNQPPWGGLLAFGMWGLLPFLVIIALSRRWASSRAAQILLTVAAVIVTLFAMSVFYEALFTKKNSTFGLAFLFLPIYQLVVVVPLSLAAWWAARRGEQL